MKAIEHNDRPVSRGSVLDCGSPLPLSTASLPSQSARGLAHSRISRPEGWFIARAVVSLLPFFLAFFTSAAPQVAWQARYSFGTNSDSKVFAIALDPQQNIVVAGTSKNDQGNDDYVTAKYTASGSNVWTRRYDSGGADQVRGLALDSEGNVLLTGTSVTVKYGADGTEMWTAPYGGLALAVDSSNHVVVTGFSTADFATVKLTPQGSNVWVRTLDRIGQADVSHAVAVDAADSVFVAGTQVFHCDRPPLNCYAAYYVVKYDASGNQLWVEKPEPLTLGQYPWSQVIGLDVDKEGNLIMTANNFGNGDFKYYTAKFSNSGQSLWQWAHPNQDVGGVRASILDHQGNIYLTGGIRIGYYVCKTYKLAPNSVPSWLANYSGIVVPSDNFGNAIALDAATNVYVTGQSTGPGTASDWATIKYSASGQEQWVVRYDGPVHGEDQATAIAVDNTVAIYAAGFTATTNGIEMLIIKYVELQPIQVQTNQSVLLQFLGTPGQSYRFLATTNFADWDELGAAIADPLGLYQWLDTNQPLAPHKFYRTVTP